MKFAYVEDHRHDGGRSGEGSAVFLDNGDILLLYSAFRGNGHADHSAAEIWARRSSDGLHWSDPTVAFRAPGQALNVMAASVLRLADGRIGGVFAVKWSTTHCVPHWTTSSDEGQTWTEAVPMTSEEEYFVVNNDRLVQLQNGTLVLPYALHRGMARYADDKELLKDWLNAWCGLLVSEDGGMTWSIPDHARRYEKQWFAAPEPLQLEGMPEVEQRALREKYDVFQEPGVIQRADGGLLMWARSLSHIFVSTAADPNAPWRDYMALPGMNVQCSPQTIKRVPGNGSLVMIYNDRGSVPFGTPEFQFRTPLSVAVSVDEGSTWTRRNPIEPDTAKNYCYPSLVFQGEEFLLSYYESAEARKDDGSLRRRNLASLKVCRGTVSELLGRA